VWWKVPSAISHELVYFYYEAVAENGDGEKAKKQDGASSLFCLVWCGKNGKNRKMKKP
jgi:hypothetical protein